MTQARHRQISLTDTPYYHCIARCVRRAFLCGSDSYSGRSFEHRRQWVVDRMRQLSDVFAINICAYAIMHNHYHLVLRVDEDSAKSWSTHAVIRRWHCLFRGTLLSQRFLKGETLSNAEMDALNERIVVWRERLMSISWFMKELNEHIAREANKEDSCKGRFWESRFKSQALLDNTALLACMVYVDLNPVRADIADSIESSEFTSVQQRLRVVTEQRKKKASISDHKPIALLPFTESERFNTPAHALPFNLKDYLDLVDFTGRIARDDKRGSIPTTRPRLLDQLALDDDQWRLLALEIQQHSLTALGSLEQLEIYHASIDKRWMSKQRYLKRCYQNTG